MSGINTGPLSLHYVCGCGAVAAYPAEGMGEYGAPYCVVCEGDETMRFAGWSTPAPKTASPPIKMLFRCAPCDKGADLSDWEVADGEGSGAPYCLGCDELMGYIGLSIPEQSIEVITCRDPDGGTDVHVLIEGTEVGPRGRRDYVIDSGAGWDWEDWRDCRDRNLGLATPAARALLLEMYSSPAGGKYIEGKPDNEPWVPASDS